MQYNDYWTPDIPPTAIICRQCECLFDLAEAPGAAMILPDGQFVGRCPQCGHEHEAKHRETLQ